MALISLVLYQGIGLPNLPLPPSNRASILVSGSLTGRIPAAFFVLFLAGSGCLFGQTPPSANPPSTPPSTRADEIEAERTAKAAAYAPPSGGGFVESAEKFVTRGLSVWNGLQTGTRGLSANIGGLAVGSQIAVGPEYTLRAGNYYHPALVWDTYAVGAGDLSYRLQSGVELPRLGKGHLFFNFFGYRYEYTRLLYFGPGNYSDQSGVTDYAQRESGIDLRAGLIARKRLRAGITGNLRAIAIGPGTDPGLRASDSVYNSANARGIDRQTDFLAGGFFAEYEGRDVPGDPHRGIYLSTHFQNISGSRRALGGFNQYDWESQFYVPFWNNRRVLAIRAKASMTTPHNNTFVPFYLEPRLGGGDDLRGFSSFRFHDQNAVVATVEYRWTVLPVLDMAVFGDAGKVYADADAFSIRHLHTDVGVGVRARAANSVPFRFDIGISQEGAQFWLVLANIF